MMLSTFGFPVFRHPQTTPVSLSDRSRRPDTSSKNILDPVRTILCSGSYSICRSSSSYPMQIRIDPVDNVRFRQRDARMEIGVRGFPRKRGIEPATPHLRSLHAAVLETD
jgi:hypothetical protein